MTKHKLKIGDKVKLTGKFLKNTGQRTGSAGLDEWIVMGFWGDDDCFALVNEPHACQSDPTGYEDLAPEDRPKWRGPNHREIAMLTYVRQPEPWDPRQPQGRRPRT